MPRQPKLKKLTNCELVDAYLAQCTPEERVSVETLLAKIEANYKARNITRDQNLAFGVGMAKDLLGALLRWSGSVRYPGTYRRMP